MAGKTVAPLASIHHQHLAAGTQKLQGGGHSGVTAPDLDDILHALSFLGPHLGVAVGEITGQIGQGHFGKTVQKQRLGLGHGLTEGCINCLFDKARGGLMPMSQGMERGLAQSLMQVARRDSFHVGHDPPAFGMAALRSHKLPLMGPALASTGLLAFIAAWNEFLFALTFFLTDNHRTIPVAIGLISGASRYEYPFGPIMAASVIVTLPLIVLVLIFQRKIVAGLTAGAANG